MSNAADLNRLMLRVDEAAASLIANALVYDDAANAWNTRVVLASARAYADAIRAVRNEHRNAKRRAKAGAK